MISKLSDLSVGDNASIIAMPEDSILTSKLIDLGVYLKTDLYVQLKNPKIDMMKISININDISNINLIIRISEAQLILVERIDKLSDIAI